MRLFLTFLTITLLLGSASSSLAVVEQEVIFDNPKTEKRYKSLIAELRCLVCQNQNLADSDAELAKDLRRKTVEMLKTGASDDDVRTYMSDRYGDFVLFGIIFHMRKRQQDALLKRTHANNGQTRIKVQNLLKNTPTLEEQKISETNNSKKHK